MLPLLLLLSAACEKPGAVSPSSSHQVFDLALSDDFVYALDEVGLWRVNKRGGDREDLLHRVDRFMVNDALGKIVYTVDGAIWTASLAGMNPQLLIADAGAEALAGDETALYWIRYQDQVPGDPDPLPFLDRRTLFTANPDGTNPQKIPLGPGVVDGIIVSRDRLCFFDGGGYGSSSFDVDCLPRSDLSAMPTRLARATSGALVVIDDAVYWLKDSALERQGPADAEPVTVVHSGLSLELAADASALYSFEGDDIVRISQNGDQEWLAHGDHPRLIRVDLEHVFWVDSSYTDQQVTDEGSPDTVPVLSSTRIMSAPKHRPTAAR
jgi:hypothetical protein